MKKIKGKNFKEVKSSIKDKIISLLASTNKIKVDDDIIPIDPLLLFQKLHGL